MISNDEITCKMIEKIRLMLKGNLNKVILYGSMARGDYNAESDFDCIIIVNKINMEVYDVIDEVAAYLLLNFDAVLSIIPVTENNIKEQIYNPLYVNARREGIVLWQTTA